MYTLCRPGATPAAILLSFEAVFAAIFGALLLDERMNGQEIVGAAVMFCGVVVSQLRRGPRAERRAGTDASL